MHVVGYVTTPCPVNEYAANDGNAFIAVCLNLHYDPSNRW
jgi:hypothetical protein